MQQKELPEWLWSWILSVERRLTRNEERLGTKTTERDGERQQWTPRDLLIASAGIAMVIGTLCEKTGLTGVGFAVLKAVAKAYGEK